MNADDFVEGLDPEPEEDADEEEETDAAETETDEADEEDALETAVPTWADDGTAYAKLDEVITSEIKAITPSVIELVTHLRQMKDLLSAQGNVTADATLAQQYKEKKDIEKAARRGTS